MSIKKKEKEKDKMSKHISQDYAGITTQTCCQNWAFSPALEIAEVCVNIDRLTQILHVLTFYLTCFIYAHLRINCRHRAALSETLQSEFPKCKAILLYNHNTVLKTRNTKYSKYSKYTKRTLFIIYNLTQILPIIPMTSFITKENIRLFIAFSWYISLISFNIEQF